MRAFLDNSISALRSSFILFEGLGRQRHCVKLLIFTRLRLDGYDEVKTEHGKSRFGGEIRCRTVSARGFFLILG